MKVWFLHSLVYKNSNFPVDKAVISWSHLPRSKISRGLRFKTTAHQAHVIMSPKGECRDCGTKLGCSVKWKENPWANPTGSSTPSSSHPCLQWSLMQENPISFLKFFRNPQKIVSSPTLSTLLWSSLRSRAESQNIWVTSSEKAFL